jgi:putative Holliday junction resolvase
MVPALHRRILAIDAGGRRVGVAVSDEMHLIASPVKTVDMRHGGWDELLTIIQGYDPELVVIGLPTGMSGREGPQATAVRRFAEKLREATGRKIRFHDERLTSFMAEQALIESGRKPKQRKQRIDAVAAALILQSYLDATRG